MMNPLEIKKLKERAPLPLILGTIMMFLPMLLVEPQQAELADAELRFDQSLKSLRETLGQRRAVRQQNRESRAMQEQIDRINRWLSPEAELPTTIDRLQQIAESMSVVLSSIQYRFPRHAAEHTPPRISITFDLQGNYQSMRSFLRALEYFPLPFLPVEISANRDNTFRIELIHLVQP
jgi:Tfp pilus assembly protein PilO